MAETVRTRRELEERIAERASKDEAFRSRFLADPKGVIQEFLGARLPDSVKVSAFAEGAEQLHFVVPAKPPEASELSDADLERVAGGAQTPPIIIVTVVVGLLSAISATVHTNKK